MISMADVYIVTFTLIGILLTWPGLAAALNLLLPKVTESAYIRLAQTPVKSFLVGVPVTAIFAFWIMLLANLGVGLLQAVAFITFLIALGFNAIGAAAMARLLGDRIEYLTNSGTPLSNMVRGAIIYEFACLFPLIGWFIFMPVAGITVMGAATFGVLRWVPRPKPVPQTSPLLNHLEV